MQPTLMIIALLYVSITGYNFSQVAGPNFLTSFCAVIALMVIAPFTLLGLHCYLLDIVS